MIKKLKLVILAALLITPFFLFPTGASAATTIAITSPSSSATVSGGNFTVSGTATANRKITVSINGTEVGTTTSNGSGSWSLDVTGQTAGSKTIEATATGEFMYSNILNTADCSGSPAVSRMTIINTLNNSE